MSQGALSSPEVSIDPFGTNLVLSGRTRPGYVLRCQARDLLCLIAARSHAHWPAASPLIQEPDGEFLIRARGPRKDRMQPLPLPVAQGRTQLLRGDKLPGLRSATAQRLLRTGKTTPSRALCQLCSVEGHAAQLESSTVSHDLPRDTPQSCRLVRWIALGFPVDCVVDCVVPLLRTLPRQHQHARPGRHAIVSGMATCDEEKKAACSGAGARMASYPVATS